MMTPSDGKNATAGKVQSLRTKRDKRDKRDKRCGTSRFPEPDLSRFPRQA
jgi:hypothetical protein